MPDLIARQGSTGRELHRRALLTDDLVESLEAMVEAVLVLCTCAPERTGLMHTSLDLLDELGRTVMNLDGRAPYPGGQRPLRG